MIEIRFILAFARQIIQMTVEKPEVYEQQFF